MSKDLQILQEKFPFLTLFEYSGQEFVGIIQNHGKNVVSAYVYNNIKDPEQKRRFIELALVWWEESNRKIPINLFFKSDFDEFIPFVTNYVAKEFKIISGHSVSLQGLNQKRVKRRRVELIIKNK
jgi:hypothetical protein